MRWIHTISPTRDVRTAQDTCMWYRYGHLIRTICGFPKCKECKNSDDRMDIKHLAEYQMHRFVANDLSIIDCKAFSNVSWDDVERIICCTLLVCQVSVMFSSRVIVKPCNAIYVSLSQINENFKRNSSKIKRPTTKRTTNMSSYGSASHRYCVADCKTYKNKTKLRKWQMTSWVDVIRQTDAQNRIFHETS